MCVDTQMRFRHIYFALTANMKLAVVAQEIN